MARIRDLIALSVAALTVVASVGPVAARAEDEEVFLTKTVAAATVTPTLSLSLSGSRTDAIPGDPITYTSTLSNAGAVIGVSGRIIQANRGGRQATVVAYWDVISTKAPPTVSPEGGDRASRTAERTAESELEGRNRCSESESWTPFAGQAANVPSWTVLRPAPITTGMTLTAIGLPRPGVTFPATGDPFLGTVLDANATARWNYQASLNLTPDQVKFLFDKTKVCAVRNTIHVELALRKRDSEAGARPASSDSDREGRSSTYSTEFSTKLLASGQFGDVIQASIVITPPGGTAATFNSATTPALADIPPGGSVTVTLPSTVPVISPRGTAESETDYLARLRLNDGLRLTATATAAGTGSSGALTATAAPVTTTEHVPVLTIAKRGPATVDAGLLGTYPLDLVNSGSATALAIAATDVVPGGLGGTVSGTPASLAPTGAATATATFLVSVLQPAGPLTDTAAVTWQDANSNPYGSVSSSFTTTVRNPLLGAQLTLSPTRAGPNFTGTSQALTAILLDVAGHPMAGQTINFGVTGANPTTGSATTDASGSASFSYTGTVRGNDVVQASVTVGGVTLPSNTAAISWVAPSLQKVSLTAVQGDFYPNPQNLCTFGPTGSPTFSQSFPDIQFNPAPNSVPHSLPGVDQTTRPFTDVTLDINGNYNGTIVAQGNGSQAGVGNLTNFFASLSGSFLVSQAGDFSFTVSHDSGYLLGVGNGATRVNGDNIGGPVQTAFQHYPVVAAFDAGGQASGVDTIHFPVPGLYPYELDYTECGGQNLTLTLAATSFTAQTDPLSIYVGYADGLRAGSIFPFPWDGSPNVTFIGGGQMDSAALRFDNNGPAPINFDNVVVDVPGRAHYDIWPHGMTVPPGGILVLAQTNGTNFDSSDVNGTGCGQNSGIIPIVSVTVAGITKTYKDTNQVINTLGYDTACVGNESISWQRIAGSAAGINVPLPPAFAINLTPFRVSDAVIGEPVKLLASVLDEAGKPIAGVQLQVSVYGANARTLSATTDAAGLASISYIGGSTGTDLVQASGFVDGLRSISDMSTVIWLAGPGGITRPPNAGPPPSIGAPVPADGSIVTKPVAINASITAPAGQTIASWSVTYQALDPGPVVPLAGGTGTPPNPLATFDPTVLTNDTYALTVIAAASGGGIQAATTSIAVIGNLKPGRNVQTFQDLAVPVNGFSLDVRRTYDSFDKSLGDFGIGWRVGVSNFRTAPNRVLGAGGWTQYNSQCVLGLCFTAFKNSAPRFVTVTFPDQHTEVFDFTPTGGTNLFWEGAAAYTARPGTATTSTLKPLGCSSLGYTGDGNLYGCDGHPYNPQQFQLTTRDGRVLVLDRTTGLVSMTDRNGNRLTLDAAGVHSSSGPGITFTRDGSGRITTVTGPSAEQLQYAYSAAGDLALVTDALGKTTTFNYDSKHNLLAAHGPGGQALQTLQYDTAGRLTAVTDATGHTSHVTNDVSAQTEVVTDPLGLTTLLTFDDLGDVVRADITAAGQTLTSTYAYDAAGHTTSHTDPTGATTTAAYDGNGNLSVSTDSAGRATHFAYDANNQPTTVTGPDGVLLMSSTYDANGNPTMVTSQGGATQTYSYDSAGRLATTTDAAGRSTSLGYDANGHVASITDPAGNVNHVTTDVSGRTVAATNALGGTTSMAYDANGDLLSVTSDGARVQHLTYDAFGNVLTSVDALGLTTTYAYDASERLATATGPDGATTSYSYDADGRMTRVTYPDGDFVSYVYDAFGRASQLANNHSTVANTYDAGNNLVNQTTTGIPGQPSVTIGYAYDASGARTSMTGADGTTHYGYDANGRLSSITDPAGRSFGLTYNAGGELLGLTRPNGVNDAFSYDTTGRLVSRTSSRGGTTLAQFTQSYNRSGLVATLTDSTGPTSYTYDARGQLVGVSSAGGTVSYTYDADGNRVGGPLGPATFNADNQLLNDARSSYTYDAQGNRVSRTDAATSSATSYRYNSRHQLVSVTHANGTTSSFAYDPLGRRISVTDGAQTTGYAYDGQNIHLEYAGAGLAASYVGDLKVDEPLEMTRGGAPQYYVQDARGSTALLTDSAGAVSASYHYDAFGNPTTSTGTVGNPLTYNGREYLASAGLYYNRARYYDPSTGSFLSTDPLPSVNSYPYANNDPVNFSDPGGASALGEYALNLVKTAIAHPRLLGCGLAVVAAAVEATMNHFTHTGIDWRSLAIGTVVGCALAAWLITPTGANGAAYWLLYLFGGPIMAGLAAGGIDAGSQLLCAGGDFSKVNAGHSVRAAGVAAGVAYGSAFLGIPFSLTKDALQLGSGVGIAVVGGVATGVNDANPSSAACP